MSCKEEYIIGIIHQVEAVLEGSELCDFCKGIVLADCMGHVLKSLREKYRSEEVEFQMEVLAMVAEKSNEGNGYEAAYREVAGQAEDGAEGGEPEQPPANAPSTTSKH